MEQIYKRNIPSRSADKPSPNELILMAHSNAISGLGGSSFAVMPVELKRILGIKKVLINQDTMSTQKIN